jgi:hypothetical protein
MQLNRQGTKTPKNGIYSAIREIAPDDQKVVPTQHQF